MPRFGQLAAVVILVIALTIAVWVALEVAWSPVDGIRGADLPAVTTDCGTFERDDRQVICDPERVPPPPTLRVPEVTAGG